MSPINPHARDDEEKRKQIQASRIVFQAKAKVSDGVIVVVLYSMSSEWKCFFVYHAKTFHTRRKSWALIEIKPFSAARPYNPRGASDPSVNHLLANFRGIIGNWKVKNNAQKATNSKLYALANPTRQPPPEDATFFLVEKKTRKALSGRRIGSYFSHRDRSRDQIPIPNNEAWVYYDFCTECGEKHRFVHYPSGKTNCKVGYGEMHTNPAFYYIGHISAGILGGIFKYGYKVPISPKRIEAAQEKIKLNNSTTGANY